MRPSDSGLSAPPLKRLIARFCFVGVVHNFFNVAPVLSSPIAHRSKQKNGLARALHLLGSRCSSRRHAGPLFLSEVFGEQAERCEVSDDSRLYGLIRIQYTCVLSESIVAIGPS